MFDNWKLETQSVHYSSLVLLGVLQNEGYIPFDACDLWLFQA